MKELKDPLAVEVEHSQIIGLVQIAFDRVKVPAVALSGERQGNLERDELADTFCLSTPRSFWSSRDWCEVRMSSGPLAVSSRSDFIGSSFAPLPT